MRYEENEDFGGFYIAGISKHDYSAFPDRKDDLYISPNDAQTLLSFLQDRYFVEPNPIKKTEYEMKTEFFEISCRWAFADIEMDRNLAKMREKHKDAVVDDWEMTKRDKETVFIIMKISWTEEKK